MNDISQNQPKSHITDRTSLTLLARARASNPEAWQQLVDLYGPLVFSWCLRSNLKDEDAADVVQEVFLAVARNFDQFRRDRAGDTFRGWLRVIARNQIRMHYRRNADKPLAMGGSTANVRMSEIPDTAIEDDEDTPGEEKWLYHRGLEMIRAQFEERTWQAFWKVTVEGDSIDDVARELAMSTGGVRQSKYKILKRLREELGEIAPSHSCSEE